MHIPILFISPVSLGDTIHQSQPVLAASELLPGTKVKFIRSKSFHGNPSLCMVISTNLPPITYNPRLLNHNITPLDLFHTAVTLASPTSTPTPTYQNIPTRFLPITQRPTYFEKCKHNISRHIVRHKRSCLPNLITVQLSKPGQRLPKIAWLLMLVP
jgi:hypothetical protein